MSEKKITELLEKISKSLDSELKVTNERVPLVTSYVYNITKAPAWNLQLKIAESITFSTKKTTVSIDLKIENVHSSYFRIQNKKGIASLFLIQKFKLSGDANNKYAQFWMSELSKYKIAGINTFNIEQSEGILTSKLRTSYLKTCESILSIFLSFVKEFDELTTVRPNLR